MPADHPALFAAGESDTDYRRRREREELDAADRSSCVVRDLHLEMAENYAAPPHPAGVGFTPGTVADILAEIATTAGRDPAAAATRAEGLRRSVLQAIAAGAEDAPAMAKLALLSIEAAGAKG